MVRNVSFPRDWLVYSSTIPSLSYLHFFVLQLSVENPLQINWLYFRLFISELHIKNNINWEISQLFMVFQFYLASERKILNRTLLTLVKFISSMAINKYQLILNTVWNWIKRERERICLRKKIMYLTSSVTCVFWWEMLELLLSEQTRYTLGQPSPLESFVYHVFIIWEDYLSRWLM